MNMDFIIRIIVCFLLSIAIGIERQYRHKLVGLRTNVLVSLGAFMFNWVTFASLDSDSTRIAAQVVSGIGFLGAGIIMKDGNKVKGLNTAATLWCVAAIGVMTSSGLLIEASIGTIMVLASNIILRFISISIMNRVKNNQRETCILQSKVEKRASWVDMPDIHASVRTSDCRDSDKADLVDCHSGCPVSNRLRMDSQYDDDLR